MKKFLLAIALAVATVLTPTAQAFDLGQTDFFSLQKFLNNGSVKGAGALYDLGTQVVQNSKHVIRCTYSFGTQGGAISAISLRNSTSEPAVVGSGTCKLPKGALVTNAYIDAITTLTSGGSATVALSTGETAGDILAALAYNDAKFTGAASHPAATILVGTAATAIKMTADRTPTATIAVAALTAGKFYVLIEYDLTSTL